MPRLFVAIDFPPGVRQALQEVQPAREKGIRPVSSDALHLTLKFIGEAKLEPISNALAEVEAERLSLRIHGLGCFRGGRTTILWAGLEKNERLSALHAQVEDALEKAGIRREKRRFKPHITLARCKPWAPRRVIDTFLTRRGFQVAPFHVTAFHLYTSELSPAGPRYTCEGTFPLGPI